MRARTIAIEELADAQRGRLLELMADHFENVDERRFAADLEAKRWIILLEQGARLCGFSTQTAFELEHEGRGYVVFFSGDTVVERSHWGSMALPLEFMRLVLRVAAAVPRSRPVWLLTTKGFRTYRFLPVFYEDFYPRYDAPDQACEQRLCDAIATRLFGTRYDASSGLLVAAPAAQRLRARHADVPDRERKDPHVSYFLARNPGFAGGDELVCLASVERQNFKAFALARAIGAPQ